MYTTHALLSHTSKLLTQVNCQSFHPVDTAALFLFVFTGPSFLSYFSNCHSTMNIVLVLEFGNSALLESTGNIFNKRHRFIRKQDKNILELEKDLKY